VNDRWFVKKPCQHCPFLRDVTPFLHPHRGEELAYLTENRYSELGGASCPEGFTPSADVYSEPYEMAQAYADEWERRRG
jgi:hypothetical protein